MSETKTWQTRYKFSYSEKRDIVVCPHRYELIAIQKVQTIDADVVRRLLVANCIDAALDTWVKNVFAGSLEEIAVAGFQVYCRNNERSICWKHPMDQRECELKLREGAKRLDAAMREAGMCRTDAVSQPQVKAILDLSNGEQLKLTGRLDLHYTDEPSVWDLKMTDNPVWLDVKQLIYYDFVMSLQTGNKVRRCGFLAPLMNPVVREIPPVGREEWEALIEELNWAVAHVAQQQFPDLGDPSKDCHLCFAKRFCKRFARGGPSSISYDGKQVKVGF